MLSVFYISITLVDVHLNWLNLFRFFFLMANPLVILIDYVHFQSTISVSRSYKDVYINSFFSSPIAILWSFVYRILSFDL